MRNIDKPRWQYLILYSCFSKEYEQIYSTGEMKANEWLPAAPISFILISEMSNFILKKGIKIPLTANTLPKLPKAILPIIKLLWAEAFGSSSARLICFSWYNPVNVLFLWNFPYESVGEKTQ